MSVHHEKYSIIPAVAAAATATAAATGLRFLLIHEANISLSLSAPSHHEKKRGSELYDEESHDT